VEALLFLHLLWWVRVLLGWTVTRCRPGWQNGRAPFPRRRDALFGRRKPFAGEPGRSPHRRNNRRTETVVQEPLKRIRRGRCIGAGSICVSTLLDNADLALSSDYTDPDRVALFFWILQARLLRLLFVLERFRQGRKLAVDVLEEQPPLDDFGHE
jgi:hypothetical protein